jgi:hypothetical protein
MVLDLPDLTINRGPKQIWHYDWQEETSLVFPFGGQPFACILWNNRPGYVADPLIEQLLQAECKYFVFGGEECEQWHDTADIFHLNHY